MSARGRLPLPLGQQVLLLCGDSRWEGLISAAGDARIIVRGDVAGVEAPPPGSELGVVYGVALGEVAWRARLREVRADCWDIDLVDGRLTQRRDAVRMRGRIDGVVVRFPDGSQRQGWAMDLSATGMQVAAPAAWRQGETVHVTVPLPQSDPVHAVARVARVPRHGHAGLAFVEISGHDAERIVQYVFAWQRQEQAARLPETSPRHRRP